MTDLRCGTYAGWNAHVKRGDVPCRACCDARNDYNAWRRFRNGSQPLRRCRACGSAFTAHRCEGTR